MTMTPDEIVLECELVMNSWTAQDRVEIAAFAAWCWGCCYGDNDPGCERQYHDVMSGNPAILAYYGPQWVQHSGPVPVTTLSAPYERIPF